MFVELIATILSGLGIYMLFKSPKENEKIEIEKIEEVTDCWSKNGERQ